MAESLQPFADSDDILHPPQEGSGTSALQLDVHRFVAVEGVLYDRKEKLLGIGGGKAGIPVGVPLHRRPDTIAVAQVNIVSHADLIAIIDARASGQAEQKAVQQLDATAVVVEQGCQSAADPFVELGAVVLSKDLIEVVAFFLGDHREHEVIVVAQEKRPLTGIRDRRRLFENIDDRIAVFSLQGHKHAGHQREVVVHMALIALPEILGSLFGP